MIPSGFLRTLFASTAEMNRYSFILWYHALYAVFATGFVVPNALN
jgi:hypothetical protein